MQNTLESQILIIVLVILFSIDILNYVLAYNEPVELLVFYLIFNQNTLTGLFSFNNQKRLRFWTIFIFASLKIY